MRAGFLALALVLILVAVSGCVSEAPGPEVTPEAPVVGEQITEIWNETVEPAPAEPEENKTVPVVQGMESTCGNGVCEEIVLEIKKDGKKTVTVDGEEHEFALSSVASVTEAIIRVDGNIRSVQRGRKYGVDGRLFSISDITYDPSPEKRSITIELAEGENCPDDCAWECSNGAQQACGIDVGVCEHGVQVCSGYKWGPCTGGIEPENEVCGNGLDDDCDGYLDEGCRGVEESVCGNGECEIIDMTVKKDAVATARINGVEHRVQVMSVGSVIEAVVSIDYRERTVYKGEDYTITVSSGNLDFTVSDVFYNPASPNLSSVKLSFPETGRNCPEDCG
ncbi:MAG: hypothetical protein ACE5FW_01800 [Candidatus Aenigmatarchaeota archaeon]